MGAQHSPGPWSVPHFARDEVRCDCRYILGGDSFMGGIGEVYVDNGKPISDGGNDCPKLDEAKANARLIAAAPELLEALIDARAQLQVYERYRSGEGFNDTRINAAILKATGA